MSEKENQDLRDGVLWEKLYTAEMPIPSYLKGEALLLWACNEALLELRHYHNKSDFLLWRADRILQKSIDRYEIERSSDG